MTFASTVEIDSEPLHEWHSLFLQLIAQRLNRERRSSMWEGFQYFKKSPNDVAIKTFNTVQNVTWKDKSVWKWQNQEKLNNLKYFENEQLISFQTGTRFCERVKRILLKSPPRIIKVVRLLFLQRVRQDIRSIVCWDLYLHTKSEIVSEHNFWVCWPT